MGTASGWHRIMQAWINGPATDRMKDKIKMSYILDKNQYSSVAPFYYFKFGTNSKALKY
jgi:hypothetical protein